MRTTSRYIPMHALPIEEPGLGVAYVYPTIGKSGARYGVIAYREKAIHSDFHYSYRTDAEVDQKIAQFFDDIRKHRELVAKRRADDFKGHDFKVGDIVTNSWGYDQTNVDWYRVSKATKNYVWLKPVVATLIPDEGAGPMSGRVGLALDEHLKPVDKNGPETKHRASGEYVSMRHGCGSKHTGGSLYESWYA